MHDPSVAFSHIIIIEERGAAFLLHSCNVSFLLPLFDFQLAPLSLSNRALFEQFRRLANVYFLVVTVLMMLGTYTDLYVSPLTPYTTLIPLCVVLAITMGKEGFEVHLVLPIVCIFLLGYERNVHPYYLKTGHKATYSRSQDK